MVATFRRRLEHLGALSAARAICEAYGLPDPGVLAGRERTPRVASARAEFAAWLKKSVPQISYREIGALLGGRTQSNVSTMVRSLEYGRRSGWVTAPGLDERLATPRDRKSP